MKIRDLVTRSDREVLAFLRVLSKATVGNEAEFGLSALETAELAAAADEFEQDLDGYDAARALAKSKSGKRKVSRRRSLSLAGGQAAKVRVMVGNDPAKLSAIGLTPRDMKPTAAPEPNSIPVATVEYDILKHTIRFRDASTPQKRARPKGMLGAEVWRKVGGEAPRADSDFQMTALQTASPHVIFYSKEDGGKTVYYRLRWLSRSGKKGGWSEVVEATVNG